MTAAGQLHQAPAATRALVAVARILSNGWQFMRCDRCTHGLVEMAECYQVEIGFTASIYCPKCHGRNRREHAYEQRALVMPWLSSGVQPATLVREPERRWMPRS